MTNLSGQIALITGAGRGLGRSIARALAQAGADIAVNYKTQADKAESTVQAICAMGQRCMKIAADVSRAAEVDHTVSSVEKVLGPISILVNNAGVTRPQALEEITEQDFDDLIAINLKSTFLMTQRVLPAMRAARFGRIINLSSVAAQTGGIVGPHYAASKAGQIGLTHSYANLLAKEGITVNAIAPALVRSDMTAGNPRAQADLIPVGRMGEPDEVASVVVMLAGNGYITGQTINVNGGWYMSS